MDYRIEKQKFIQSLCRKIAQQYEEYNLDDYLLLALQREIESYFSINNDIQRKIAEDESILL